MGDDRTVLQAESLFTLWHATRFTHGLLVHSVLQVLHVEQEIVGDDRSVLQAVLDCDSERSALLKVRYRYTTRELQKYRTVMHSPDPDAACVAMRCWSATSSAPRCPWCA